MFAWGKGRVIDYELHSPVPYVIPLSFSVKIEISSELCSFGGPDIECRGGRRTFLAESGLIS